MATQAGQENISHRGRTTTGYVAGLSSALVCTRVRTLAYRLRTGGARALTDLTMGELADGPGLPGGIGVMTCVLVFSGPRRPERPGIPGSFLVQQAADPGRLPILMHHAPTTTRGSTECTHLAWLATISCTG